MNFEELVEHLTKELKTNSYLLHNLQQIATKVYMEASGKVHNEGFCLSFKIPEKDLKQYINMLGIDVNDLKNAFEKEYHFPRNSQMYGNEYYQILILLYYVFKKIKLDKYAKLALFLILIRMWNGRKYKYIKYCNKSVMDYVINQKITRRNLASRYHNPLDLIIKYFVETIDSKYGPYILKDRSKLKLFFNQCFVRIDQLFNNAQNTGLANLYFKVHQSGEALHTSKLTIRNSEDENVLTIHDIESRSQQIRRIADLVSSNISLSTNQKYPVEFINIINKKTKLSRKFIESLAKEIHNPQYKQQIEDLIVIIANRLKIYSSDTLCSYTDLINIIDKSFVSSKHNKDVEEYKKILRDIANDILKRISGKTLDSYSVKVQILRALTYIISYNIINTVCKIKV